MNYDWKIIIMDKSFYLHMQLPFYFLFPDKQSRVSPELFFSRVVFNSIVAGKMPSVGVKDVDQQKFVVALGAFLKK